MSYTNIPNGITSFGVPVFGTIPAIKGKYFHVNPKTGLAGNAGTYEKPFASIATAYSKCTSGKGDGIILWSMGTTSAETTSYLTASLDWTKHGITVVGIAAPTEFAGRARIANASTALSLPYLIDVQGNNNSFYNVHIGNFGSNVAAVGGLKVSGARNYFFNVHAIGAGHATPAAAAGANSLTLTAASENTFEKCTFGTDTVDGAGANNHALVHFSSGCQRNRFNDCEFMTYISEAGSNSGMFKWDASDAVTSHHVFKNCIMTNYKLGLVTTTPPASLFIGTAPDNGHMLLVNCAVLGYTAFDGVAGNDRVFVSTAAANATGGLAVVTA